MPRPKDAELIVYDDGDWYVRTLARNTLVLYAYRNEGEPGGGRRRRVSLGTSDLSVAIHRLQIFKASGCKTQVLKNLRLGAQVGTEIVKDLTVADAIARFIEHPDHQGTRRFVDSAKRLLPTLEAVAATTKLSRLTKGVQKAIIRHLRDDRGYAVNTVIVTMEFVNRVAIWCSEPDDNDEVKATTRRKIISTPNAVCKVLGVPKPEARNWSPDPATMGRILALLADDEPARRWALVMLTFGCRVTPALVSSGEQLRFEQYALRAKDEVDHQTKRRPELPVAWSSLREFRSWGSGRWVNLSEGQLRGRVDAIAEQLDLPELCPSSFRDYVTEALRHADEDFPVRPVSEQHLERWQGHGKSTTNRRYGRFRKSFLVKPRVATEAMLRDLDRRSGGALFRQGIDQTPLLELYPARIDDGAEPDDISADADTYADLMPAAGMQPATFGLQDLEGVSDRVAPVILGDAKLQTGEIGAIRGEFRQIADDMYDDLSPLDQPFRRPLLERLNMAGIRLYERNPWTTSDDTSGIFVVGPCEQIIPLARVADLLKVVRPRLLNPREAAGPKRDRIRRIASE